MCGDTSNARTMRTHCTCNQLHLHYTTCGVSPTAGRGWRVGGQRAYRASKEAPYTHLAPIMRLCIDALARRQHTQKPGYVLPWPMSCGDILLLCYNAPTTSRVSGYVHSDPGDYRNRWNYAHSSRGDRTRQSGIPQRARCVAAPRSRESSGYQLSLR